MADKKPEKKPEVKRPIDLVVLEAVLVLLLAGGVISFLVSWFGFKFSAESFKVFLYGLLSSLQAISAFISLLFIMGIIYASFKAGQIKRAQIIKEKMQEITTKKTVEAKKSENKKWKKVLEHVSSANPSDWRLAILEADILLGDLLTKLNYKGESIGEQLKSVDRLDFQTLDLAWEAHKIRNGIAHEGSDYVLSPNEAKRVIGLFQEVFTEFRYI